MSLHSPFARNHPQPPPLPTEGAAGFVREFLIGLAAMVCVMLVLLGLASLFLDDDETPVTTVTYEAEEALERQSAAAPARDIE